MATATRSTTTPRPWQRWQLFAAQNRQPEPILPRIERDADLAHDADDFLAHAELVAAPELPGLPRRSLPGTSRAAARDLLAIDLADLAACLPDVLPNLQQDQMLCGMDGDAAWILCSVLAQTTGLRSAENGPLVDLLRRAVRAADPELARQAVGAIAALSVAEAQVDVAERLLREAASLGHDGVEQALDCLEAIGDGRCVRTMEAVLLRHGALLSEPHAWRARHIVQVIRRGGRR